MQELSSLRRRLGGRANLADYAGRAVPCPERKLKSATTCFRAGSYLPAAGPMLATAVRSQISKATTMTLQRPMFPPADPSRRGFLAQAAVVAAGGAALGMTLPLPVSAGASERVQDPIYAAIEDHKAACVRTTAAVDRQSVFEQELLTNHRLEKKNRLPDERLRETEIEAAIDQAWDDERDAACGLLNIHPTTLAGLIALLTHARDYDTDGMGWPDQLVGGDWKEGEAAGCVEDTRTWQYFLIDNLIEILPALQPAEMV